MIISEQTQTKRCTYCKQIKSLSEFFKHCRKKDGYCSECKICKLKYDKEYFQTKKGKTTSRKAVLRYRATEKGKAVFRKTMSRYCQSEKGKANYKRYRARHPERCKARDVVNHAVQAGKLPRANTMPCYYCPTQAEQYHHYKGYEPEHRLDVVPICRKCHNRLRKKIA